MVQLYELKVDKLYSKIVERDMTRSDMRDFLDWSMFNSDFECDKKVFRKEHNDLIDMINDGTAPKIKETVLRTEAGTAQALRSAENKILNQAPDYVYLTGSEENIQRFSDSYMAEKNGEYMFKGINTMSLSEAERVLDETVRKYSRDPNIDPAFFDKCETKVLKVHSRMATKELIKDYKIAEYIKKRLEYKTEETPVEETSVRETPVIKLNPLLKPSQKRIQANELTYITSAN